MKKAKLFLSAILVVTVVGGALAFKAEKVGGGLYCEDESQVNPDDTDRYVSGGTAFLYCTTQADGSTGTSREFVTPDAQ